MYDLLLKGGLVVDPANRIHAPRDVAVSEGKIAAVEPDIPAVNAKTMVDVSGKVVTPGLIDVHTHIADGIIKSGIAPDDAGVFSGVTAVCDGGSVGCQNFPAFKRYVISQSRTDVFCFVNLGPTGLGVQPEIWDWRNIDAAGTVAVIKANPETIKGIKIRETIELVQNLGVPGIEAAKKVAREVGLPIMVHIGIVAPKTISAETMTSFTRGMLRLLDRGDILTHVYNWKDGAVFGPDGTVMPELRDAIKRGVFMDVAHGISNWGVDLARKGIEQGILPTTISTDLGNMSLVSGPVFSLAVAMSKFMAAGLSLDQVIEMTTVNAARVLNEGQRRGSLSVGTVADIAVLEVKEGDYVFHSGVPGKTFNGKALIVPRLTIRRGEQIKTKERFANEKVTA